MRRSIAAGVVTLDEIKTVVASLMADDRKFTPQRLADGMMNAGLLTHWQSSKLLAGKSKGFFLGAYKLLRPLGKGGMGMVYLGEHNVMKRQMALKILNSDSSRDERRIQRFQEEARASAQLDHSNIVRAYDFNQSNGKLYIVMEYVDGIDMHQVVARDGVMSVAAALDAVYQAANGLAHAHERGIIHRDIKPSNLMLRSDGVVKVSDMGLARIGWSESTGDPNKRRLTGTADFVAPEQALNSHSVDARADIYSLGCTLFFLLTGRPPFKGDTVAQRLAKHQTAPIPDVRKLRPDCPEPLAHLLTRMMAKKPADRPPSALELIGQFDRIRRSAGLKQKNHQPLAAIASTQDTLADSQLYQATMEDQSVFSGSDPDESIYEPEEFDFSTLPDIGAATTPSAFPGSTAGLPPSPPMPASSLPSSKTSTPRDNDQSQTLMLGMGLAIAVIALMTVVGMAVYTISKPEDKASPKIKAMESGKQVVVIEGG
ncbi:serine/threonine protein kinase [Rhodopirellula halodulae]|uniref:serine/threonine protein kinase n=1 Tax=Rhodopirellula halodulae TaxID=2894198 RepID=UPI001E5F6BA0|nr:serine/threonine-protein kinase [Rhodopirellula sp. JC737]MCC9654934.1 serine/threonine protein kinase [Rhodopirellula sp. JC737]